MTDLLQSVNSQTRAVLKFTNTLYFLIV